jgi:CBS domain-containing membrane protein
LSVHNAGKDSEDVIKPRIQLQRYPFQLPWFVYLWFVVILGLFAAVDHKPWEVTAFLVPPFGASLSLIVSLPQQPVAQPLPVVLGGTIGAAVGSLMALWGHGPILAAVAALIVFVILPPLGLYFPPAVALGIFPLLVKTTPWFPLLSVLPFTLIAVGSAAMLSRWVDAWPAYPRKVGEEGPPELTDARSRQ